MSRSVPLMLTSGAVSALVVALTSLIVGPAHTVVAAQGPASLNPTAAKSAVSRTPDSRPDLQGFWSFATVTPLQRPKEFEGKAVLTNDEVAKLEERTVRDQFVDGPSKPGDVGAYNRFWLDAGTKVTATRRTSLISDPPDGKLPPLTAQALKRDEARIARRRQLDGPEDVTPYERCLVGFNAGPPILSHAYGNILQLVQTRDYIMIMTEMVHDARIVPLDGRPHLPSAIRQWTGDSRGRWDGDTLVIETTNFRKEGIGSLPLSGYGGDARNAITDETLHVIERFERVDADTLLYEVTVNNPTVWTRPWTAVMSMTRSAEPVYEYACHEGNYGLAGMLTGARAQERAQASEPPKK